MEELHNICASVTTCLITPLHVTRKKQWKSRTGVPHSTVFTYNSYFTHKVTDRKNYKLHKCFNIYIHLQYSCIQMISSCFTSHTLLVFSNKNHWIISLYKKNTTKRISHSENCWVLLCDQLCDDIFFIFNKWTMLVRLCNRPEHTFREHPCYLSLPQDYSGWGSEMINYPLLLVPRM